jgi:hypothetical protein
VLALIGKSEGVKSVFEQRGTVAVCRTIAMLMYDIRKESAKE